MSLSVSDLFGAQQRGPVQQQAEFGVSLCGGGAADGGGEGEEEQQEAAEAAGGDHLHEEADGSADLLPLSRHRDSYTAR